MRGIDRQNRLKTRQSEVGPRDLLGVPAAEPGEECDLRLGRHLGVGRRGAQLLQRLGPELHVAPGGALEIDGVRVVLRVLAEGLGEGEGRLLLVVEIALVEVPDLVEGAGALGVARRRLAAAEEHLDELLVLSEVLADLFQGRERDVVVGVELEERGVHALGLRLVLEGRLVDARGAEEQRLLELDVLDLRDLVVALLDRVGGDAEGVGDLVRVGAELDRALDREGRLAVARVREEQIDALVELVVGDAFLRLLAAGLRRGLERLEHRRDVLRARRRRLLQELLRELVELFSDPAAGRRHARRGGVLREVTDGDVDAGLAGEDRLAREDLEHQRAERVEIAREIRGLSAELLGARRLQQRDRRPRPAEQQIAADVDEDRARRPAFAARDDDVVELDRPVDEPLFVERAEGADDAAEEVARLVDVERAGAPDAHRERLPFDRRVRDPDAPALDADLEVAREVLVTDPRGEAHAGEEPTGRARATRGLASVHLEGAVGAVLRRGVDESARPFADLLRDGEGAERLAGLDLLGERQALLAELADPRIDFGARGQHGVEQGLDRVDLDAAVGEGAGERRLRRGSADLPRRKAEKIRRKRHHFFQREEALELASHDIDRH